MLSLLVDDANFWFVVEAKLDCAAAGVAGRPELHPVGPTDWVESCLRTVTGGVAWRRTRAENPEQRTFLIHRNGD